MEAPDLIFNLTFVVFQKKTKKLNFCWLTQVAQQNWGLLEWRQTILFST
jgi:hypothetical protein